MEPTNGKHSDLERRSSVRASVRLSAVGDDDEYDLLGAVVSDGMLRPTHNPSTSRPASLELRPLNHEDGALGTSSNETEGPSLRHATPAASRPSSIAKPPHHRDSLTLRGDAHHVVPDAAAAALTGVSDSPAPVQQNAPVQSERESNGPDGSSHPYDMYSPRTPNVAAMPSNSPTGPLHAPTHPYGLYPQATAPADATQPPNIPVGFPGSADNYQRRIGPEGEYVASLVGPLGHTEELPPYSRYPEESYARKDGVQGEENAQDANRPAAAMNNADPAATATTAQPQQPPQSPQSPLQQQLLQSHQPSQQQTPGSPTAAAAVASATTATGNVTPIPGAGGIGLATRDPEYSSSSNLDSPRSRLSTRSFTSEESRNEISPAGLAVVSEKEGPPLPAKKKQSKWQEKASQRAWGIVPYWAICLLAGALCLMGVILGAVIGTFLTKHRKDGQKPEEISGRNGFEVIGIDILPADLPALETGIWSLPPLVASQAPSTCFNITTQSQAWGCNPPPFSPVPYLMELQRLPGEKPTGDYSLNLYIENTTSLGMNKYVFGAALPTTSGPKQLRLVKDPEDPGYGPAWWLQDTYTKVVILSEDRFPLPAGVTPTKRRRSTSWRRSLWNRSDGGDDDKNDDKRKGGGGGGGMPVPPIFINDGSNGWMCEWPDVKMEFLVYPKSNNSLKIDSSPTLPTAFPSGTEFPMPTSTSSDGNNGNTPPFGSPAEGGDGDAGELPFDWGDMSMFGPKIPPNHPKVIKMRERRVPGPDNVAMCRLIKAKNNGQAHDPVLDTTGKPIEVVLPEKEFDEAEMPGNDKRWLDPRELYARDNPNAGLCACIWMVD